MCDVKLRRLAILLQSFLYDHQEDEAYEHARSHIIDRDALIFLIDARPRMYQPMADG